MYKLFFLIALTVSAPLAHASIENKDALVSLRYSTTDITNATLPVWGVGFANVKGGGEFGVAATIDYQTFGADWGYHLFNGEDNNSHVYLDGSWGVNVMLGTAYGLTDDLYVVPKIGGTYNKLYYGSVNSSENAAPKMNRGIEERYDVSYGVDFMFSYDSLVMGVGISNYYHFLDRETKANLLLGYRF
ncbi:hypothetical protein MW334_003532 [Vibrio parahaemolyticus]|nr:hypothetical protein [Vibrio parahaemolyticus]EJB8408345.1 hypothetical protein [Vibrio parahaemolyticus]ELA9712807.1 hypothetical protein [Vibrio parahaemolyticus]ELA9726315.1 hypothetical protein [Vibrio parahaemolyticus]